MTCSVRQFVRIADRRSPTKACDGSGRWATEAAEQMQQILDVESDPKRQALYWMAT